MSKNPIAVIEKKIWKYLYAPEFGKALKLIEASLKKYPDNFTLQHHYGATLGDAAEAYPLKKRKRLKAQASKVLLDLTKRLNGKDPAEAIRIRCEYYFHSSQFKKLYIAGVERLTKIKLEVGHYSMGVGAVWHAQDLYRRGQKSRAVRWARLAEKKLNIFIKIRPKYYNTYAHYALALGLQGRLKEAKSALTTAGRLSRKPMSYFEFVEVRDILNELGFKLP